MVRETDEEVFARVKKEKEEADAIKEELNKKEKVPNMNNQKDNNQETSQEIQPQIVEREINLSLINDKLNFIISKLQQ